MESIGECNWGNEGTLKQGCFPLTCGMNTSVFLIVGTNKKGTLRLHNEGIWPGVLSAPEDGLLSQRSNFSNRALGLRLAAAR